MSHEIKVSALSVQASSLIPRASLLAVMIGITVACGGEPSQTVGSAPVPDKIPRAVNSAPIDVSETVTTVTLGFAGFVPKRVDIRVGQQVRFVNASGQDFWPASNIHPTHQIYPELDAKAPVEHRQSWVFTFDKPGFWRYHNHLRADQHGLVVVTGDNVDVKPLVISNPDIKFNSPPSLSINDLVSLFQDDRLLLKFTELYGPSHTVNMLSEAENYANVDCHQRAHDVGRSAYDLFGAVAFSLASHECHAGSYHGATEALFRDRGVNNLQEDVAILCSNTPSRFFRHQCVHGVGHGLMAWTSYELLDALPMCDQLTEKNDRLSCYSGIFMENVVGGLSGTMGHYTSYLSDDPHFPCNILDDQYLSPCYFYQTSRMLVVFEGHYEQVAAACAVAPKNAQNECFLSYGRDVGAVTREDPARAISLCDHADNPDHRIMCLEGAVQDRFWDLQGAESALTMCHMIGEDRAKERCYWVIINRAFELYPTNDGFKDFCRNLPERYSNLCDKVSAN